LTVVSAMTDKTARSNTTIKHDNCQNPIHKHIIKSIYYTLNKVCYASTVCNSFIVF